MSKRRLSILGGCGGIGRSPAGLSAGYELAVMDLEAAFTRHPPPANTLAIDIDGSDEATVDQAFGAIGRHWGALDGFVNVAGFMTERHPLSETSADEFYSTSQPRETFASLSLLARRPA